METCCTNQTVFVDPVTFGGEHRDLIKMKGSEISPHSGFILVVARGGALAMATPVSQTVDSPLIRNTDTRLSDGLP